MVSPVTLTPSAGGFGARTVTSSAALFSDDDLGRLLSIKSQADERAAATAYVEGHVKFANDRGVCRIYRCVRAGTTMGANMAGTTPDYDLNTPILETEDVLDGSVIWFYEGRGKSAWAWGTITAVASSTVCTVDFSPNAPLASDSASVAWRLGEWGGSRGWPRAVAIYNQRTFWGGDAVNPQTVWSSETGDYESMSPTEPDGVVLDTNALTHTIDDDELNTVLWMLNQDLGLIIGTPSAEFLLGPAITTAVLGPNNTRLKPKSRRGSIAEAPGIRAGDAILFPQRGGRIERELRLDPGGDQASSADATVLSEHITATGIVDSGLQTMPLGILWHVRDDGVLCALTYDADQKVRAWTRHQLGGGAVVESVAVVPGPDGASDDVYVSVMRVLGEATVRWIEVIRAPFRAELDGAGGGFFLDAGLTYEGAPATVISGLDHLDGQMVSVRADNVDLGDAFVVSAGAITLTDPASVVHVGLPFTSRIKTLPVEAGAPPGQTAQGKSKRAHEVVLRLLESQGGTVGQGDLLEPILETEPGGALFTGDSLQVYPGGHDRLGQITVAHAGNGPLTVLAIIQELKTHG